MSLPKIGVGTNIHFKEHCLERGMSYQNLGLVYEILYEYFRFMTYVPILPQQIVTAKLQLYYDKKDVLWILQWQSAVY